MICRNALKIKKLKIFFCPGENNINFFDEIRMHNYINGVLRPVNISIHE
jgi:hypothetical protein